MSALKRIEARHEMLGRNSDSCRVCHGRSYPCDVVKLARALRSLCKSLILPGGDCSLCRTKDHLPHCAVVKAERTLEEVAG